MHKSQLITFIIPTRDRIELLTLCLKSLNSALTSLGQQDIRDFNFKAIVVFNGDPISEVSGLTHLEVNYLTISQHKPSEARNIAIKSASSNYFYFIDDDTQLPTDFLKKVCHIIRKNPCIDIFGGPDNCAPNVSIFERALEIALRSPLTTQKTNKRHTPKLNYEEQLGTERNLILCNLCVKGEVFKELGEYFPANYHRNEENVFLINVEGRVEIRYFPNLFIYHKRRHALSHVYYAASRSGFYRMRMMQDGLGKQQIVFLIPAFFLVYLIATAVIVPIWRLWEMLIPIYVYIFLNILTSALGSLKAKKPECFLFVCGYQLFIVLSYAMGTIGSIFVGLKRVSSQKIGQFRL
jgi:glycosyltransferase involved in cell wall biosynthesis